MSCSALSGERIFWSTLYTSHSSQVDQRRFSMKERNSCLRRIPRLRVVFCVSICLILRSCASVAVQNEASKLWSSTLNPVDRNATEDSTTPIWTTTNASKPVEDQKGASTHLNSTVDGSPSWTTTNALKLGSPSKKPVDANIDTTHFVNVKKDPVAHESEAKKVPGLLRYVAIGLLIACVLAAAFFAVLFILACKGMICRPREEDEEE
ncbi:hypothetical protein L596_017582 [Steinernema carpocapsae]|uniref:Uncharacterized protein n=1 Tax=Steinernema carpocapsae TaxID=34508 RepID=A0A4U5N234_STECR|nr:hypothetical protein L596_017582 [Steinernema carpocapsae]